MSEAREIRLGVLGCGTVGTSFCQLIADQAEVIEARTGIRLRVVSVSVRDLAKPRAGVDASLLTTDSAALVSDPGVDLVVETMGGVEGTRELVLAALRAGKPVVTANKALLAAHGPELYAAADEANVDIGFEAAVAAGIPLIGPLRESLVGEDISRVMGILNGTTNYILSQMTEKGADYADALADAQALGYAEADPTADVEGHDAAAKASILATLAFGRSVLGDDVHTEGISKITAEDIDDADRRGFVIKLLGVVERFDDGSIGARVFPAMVPKLHPLAAVRDSFNAVFVEGVGIDQVMLYGRGAGGHPTAAMVVGDTVNAAMNLVAKTHRRVVNLGPAVVRPVEDIESAFFVSLEVADEPGVLAAIANEFGEHMVSISSMEQEDLESTARLLFITHHAVESNFRATLTGIEALPAVKSVGRVLRVIGS
ncbi:MAG: homoserine dehydrogenase [Acidimicrobiales bacterium]|nr:homoserine dehydrogenase [Acidimicrobiales bacterium]RZV47829.1 MAG: homoserine dehydrogenase [Acidimicrobiales bacterium]